MLNKLGSILVPIVATVVSALGFPRLRRIVTAVLLVPVQATVSDWPPFQTVASTGLVIDKAAETYVTQARNATHKKIKILESIIFW